MTQGSQSCYRSIGVVGAVRSERVGTLPPDIGNSIQKVIFGFLSKNKELRGYTSQIYLLWAEPELLQLH